MWLLAIGAVGILGYLVSSASRRKEYPHQLVAPGSEVIHPQSTDQPALIGAIPQNLNNRLQAVLQLYPGAPAGAFQDVVDVWGELYDLGFMYEAQLVLDQLVALYPPSEPTTIISPSGNSIVIGA